MAIKTFINGQENGVITFKGDTEPCSVFVNGEKQDNISYIPEPISGVNSVEYSSEYKKNIRTMQIDGNTEQEQGEKTFNESASIPASFVGNGNAQTNNIVSATPINLPFEGEWELIFNYGGSAGANFEVDIAYSQADLFSYSGTRKLLYPFAEKVTVNQPFYIGVSDPTQQYLATELQQTFWNALISSGLTLAGTFQTPSPELPSPIQNAGDNGIECVLRGANLFDTDTVLGNMDTVITSIPKGWTQQADGSWYCYNIGLVVGKRLFTNTEGKQGKLTLLVNQRTHTEMVNNETGITYQIWYTDGTRDNLRPTPNIQFENYSITSNENKTVDRIQLSYGRNYGTYIKHIMINWGEPLPYQPYFHKTLSLPSSITVDGQEVELRFGIWDNLIVDRLSGKVTYTEGTLYENVSSQAFIDRTSSAFTEGRRWFQMLQTRVVENGLGYCNIVSPTTTDYGNYNHFRVSAAQIAFIIQGFASLTEFNTYKANNPIIIQCKLREPIEHTLYDKANKITTELGQQILDFVNSTQNATNIIEITSTPSVSQLSVNYAKWGGTPNANNT